MSMYLPPHAGRAGGRAGVLRMLYDGIVACSAVLPRCWWSDDVGRLAGRGDTRRQRPPQTAAPSMVSVGTRGAPEVGLCMYRFFAKRFSPVDLLCVQHGVDYWKAFTPVCTDLPACLRHVIVANPNVVGSSYRNLMALALLRVLAVPSRSTVILAALLLFYSIHVTGHATYGWMSCVRPPCYLCWLSIFCWTHGCPPALPERS